MPYIRIKTIYLWVSLIIIVPLFFLEFYFAVDHRDRVIAQRQQQSEHVALQVDNLMMGENFTAKAAIETVSKLFPGSNVGFYSLSDQNVPAYYGTQPLGSLTSWLLDNVPYDGTLLLFVSHDDIRVVRKVLHDEAVYGYVFVCTGITDVHKNFNQSLIIFSIAIITIWIIVLLLIRSQGMRFNHALEILSYQIQIDEEQQEIPKIYPDIKPIVDRINRKNSDLRNMAQKYINEAYKMKQLMDMTPLGILSIDERGTITACNATYAQFYPEFEKDRLLGMNIRTLAERSKMPGVEKIIEQALAGIPTNATTLEYDDRVLLVYAYPIYDENQVITGSLGICQDITEIEKLRNELHRIDRLHIIGQMAASFAHEVRNPLTVIRGFMQLMQKQMEPDKMQDYLQMVINELDRSNEIIGNFLSLSQNRFLQKDRINLNSIIEEIETLLQAEATHSNIELIVEKDPNLQDLMLNDKEIKQLILNLTRNGMESMNSGGKLYIRTKQSGQTAILEVQDTGHGIPQDKLNQLFEPFYTTKPSGTGLGLAVCLSIVERHQARIDVDSKEMLGTTFTIHFNAGEEAGRNAG